MDSHNRDVGIWYNRMSSVTWRQLSTCVDEDELENAVPRTIRASELPNTMSTFVWPASCKQRWAIICPVPDCTTAVNTADGAKRGIVCHFQEHGICGLEMTHAIQLFGWKGKCACFYQSHKAYQQEIVIDDIADPAVAAPATVAPANQPLLRLHPQNKGGSHPCSSVQPQHAAKRASARRLNYRRGTSAPPAVEYLVSDNWIGRGQMWVQREEKIFQDYDEQHPFPRKDAHQLEKLKPLEELRQRCRDAGVDISMKMNLKHLRHALQQGNRSLRGGRPRNAPQSSASPVHESRRRRGRPRKALAASPAGQRGMG